MFKIVAVVVMSFAALTLGARAHAADPVKAADSAKIVVPAVPVVPAAGGDPRVALLKLLPAGSKLEDMRPSPIAGIFEFSQGADVSYLTADGKFFLDGNVYDMLTRQNLTEERRTKVRASMIGAIPESEMLIFSPKNPKYTITVFTDVDCQYCRKMHSQMAELNKLGVRVRYMFYPRTGPNTESWRKAEAVWCAADRNEALTLAKAGGAVDVTKSCGQNPVAREYELGQSIGVRGTPAIVTENGSYINGYLPPKELVEEIKVLQADKQPG